MITRSLLFVLISVLLCSCTVLPDGPEHAVNLSAQLKKVQNVNAWQLRGKIAFRRANDAASANLIWQTDDDNFHFRLTNLLGVTMVDLHVTEENATLEADNKTYHDQNPEPLIYYITGMDIPVAPLLSWVKGLPLANDRYTLNDKGLLNTLESTCKACKGWLVNYANYGSVITPQGDTVWLPHTINLRQPTSPETILKIKIYQWTIN